jgi:hypothetical protein
MAVFMPVSGSFIRMGSKWVDEAFGFMLGWNFFLYGMHFTGCSPQKHHRHGLGILLHDEEPDRKQMRS